MTTKDTVKSSSNNSDSDSYSIKRSLIISNYSSYSRDSKIGICSGYSEKSSSNKSSSNSATIVFCSSSSSDTKKGAITNDISSYNISSFCNKSIIIMSKNCSSSNSSSSSSKSSNNSRKSSNNSSSFSHNSNRIMEQE